MSPFDYTPADFGSSPLMFYYEVTQACDLVCLHCRASAQPDPHPDRINHYRNPAGRRHNRQSRHQ